MRIIVTGGSGFIGSSWLTMMVPRHPDIHFLNVDALTYAANPRNCAEIADAENYSFVRADIGDMATMLSLFVDFKPTWVIHFAAETHVDRSIHNPTEFVRVNVSGTCHLLECCRTVWREASGHLFYHVSTDEVFGALGETGVFTEESRYDPRSPYAASKAASDHLVRAYAHTYGLPVIISNCSNNYGPRQFPEKMVPLMILNALQRKELPVYGDGQQRRDWLYVEDHCEAIWTVATRGKIGETYAIGGHDELDNMTMVHLICQCVAKEIGVEPAELDALITHVTDRPGHDRRYAIDAKKIRDQLGWVPKEHLESGLRKTVKWYIDNQKWVDDVSLGAYRQWIETHYKGETGGRK